MLATKRRRLLGSADAPLAATTSTERPVLGCRRRSRVVSSRSAAALRVSCGHEGHEGRPAEFAAPQATTISTSNSLCFSSADVGTVMRLGATSEGYLCQTVAVPDGRYESRPQQDAKSLDHRRSTTECVNGNDLRITDWRDEIPSTFDPVEEGILVAESHGMRSIPAQVAHDFDETTVDRSRQSSGECSRTLHAGTNAEEGGTTAKEIEPQDDLMLTVQCEGTDERCVLQGGFESVPDAGRVMRDDAAKMTLVSKCGRGGDDDAGLDCPAGLLEQCELPGAQSARHGAKADSYTQKNAAARSAFPAAQAAVGGECKRESSESQFEISLRQLEHLAWTRSTDSLQAEGETPAAQVPEDVDEEEMPPQATQLSPVTPASQSDVDLEVLLSCTSLPSDENPALAPLAFPMPEVPRLPGGEGEASNACEHVLDAARDPHFSSKKGACGKLDEVGLPRVQTVHGYETNTTCSLMAHGESRQAVQVNASEHVGPETRCTSAQGSTQVCSLPQTASRDGLSQTVASLRKGRRLRDTTQENINKLFGVQSAKKDAADNKAFAGSIRHPRIQPMPLHSSHPPHSASDALKRCFAGSCHSSEVQGYKLNGPSVAVAASSCGQKSSERHFPTFPAESWGCAGEHVKSLMGSADTEPPLSTRYQLDGCCDDLRPNERMREVSLGFQAAGGAGNQSRSRPATPCSDAGLGFALAADGSITTPEARSSSVLPTRQDLWLNSTAKSTHTDCKLQGRETLSVDARRDVNVHRAPSPSAGPRDAPVRNSSSSCFQTAAVDRNMNAGQVGGAGGGFMTAGGRRVFIDPEAVRHAAGRLAINDDVSPPVSSATAAVNQPQGLRHLASNAHLSSERLGQDLGIAVQESGDGNLQRHATQAGASCGGVRQVDARTHLPSERSTRAAFAGCGFSTASGLRVHVEPEARRRAAARLADNVSGASASWDL